MLVNRLREAEIYAGDFMLDIGQARREIYTMHGAGTILSFPYVLIFYYAVHEKNSQCEVLKERGMYQRILLLSQKPSITGDSFFLGNFCHTEYRHNIAAHTNGIQLSWNVLPRY